MAERERAIDVELPDAGPEMVDGVAIIQTGDGGVDIDFDPGNAEPAGLSDEDNLAVKMTESDLGAIADTILDEIDADIESRKEWEQWYVEGLKKCGVIKDKGGDEEGPFPGAATVVHPLIMEAATQFQSRAIEEIFPTNGPVKCGVVGESDEMVDAQRERVETHMNYQVLHEDEGYFEDTDQMLFILAFHGSIFKKSFIDVQSGVVRSKYVTAEDFIVPYTARGLRTTPRATHRMRMQPNDLRIRQLSGFYRDIELSEPLASADDAAKSIEAQADSKTPSNLPGDDDHTIYECHKFLDLKGHEHKKGKTATGRKLPYVVSVEKDSRKILSIRRNYRENDKLYRPRCWFTHYRLLPGFGFYGFGFLHAIGGLAEGATGTLRVLLDAAAFAAMQGGFKAKEARGKAAEVTIKPGVWQDIDLTAEELKNAFYTPPFREPPQALFNLLGLLVDAGRRFASTTDEMVGEGVTNVPVGTTLARIDQGSKVYSAIHKRLHMAAGEEFKQRAELNAEYLPANGKDYAFKGKKRRIQRADYDERVDVIPVSDPNIYSQGQRMAIAQAQLELSERAPDLYNKRAIHRRVLEALKVQNIDEILMDPTAIPPADPVTEGVLVTTGNPIKAYIEQDHQSHLVVHMGQMEMVKGLPIEPMFVPRMSAHVAEHYAQMYLVQMSQAMGVMIPDPSDPKRQPMPPEIEHQVSMMAAMATQQIMAERQETDPNAALAAGAIAEQQKKVEKLDVEIEQMRLETERLRAAPIDGAGDDALRRESDAVEQLRSEMASQIDAITKQRDEEVRRVRDALQKVQMEAMNRGTEAAAKRDTEIERYRIDQATKVEMETVRAESDKRLDRLSEALKNVTAQLAELKKEHASLGRGEGVDHKVMAALAASMKEFAKVEGAQTKAEVEQLKKENEVLAGKDDLASSMKEFAEAIKGQTEVVAESMEKVATELGKPSMIVEKDGKAIGVQRVDKIPGTPAKAAKSPVEKK